MGCVYGVAQAQVQSGAAEGHFERAVAPHATHCRLPESSMSWAGSMLPWRCLILRLAPPPPSLSSSSPESVSFAAAVSACQGRGQGRAKAGVREKPGPGSRAGVGRHRETRTWTKRWHQDRSHTMHMPYRTAHTHSAPLGHTMHTPYYTAHTAHLEAAGVVMRLRRLVEVVISRLVLGGGVRGL